MKNKSISRQFGKCIMLLFWLTCLIVTVFLVSCGESDNHTVSSQETGSEAQPSVIPVEVSLSDSEMEVGICTVHEIKAAGGERIAWNSSDNAVATVDADGKITGVSAGECDVIARNEFGKTARCHIVVKKSVFITIDDGPFNNCGSILRALKNNDVKATFFVVRTHDIAMIRRIHEEGHYVGLHTYSHEFAKCYRNEYSYYAGLEKLKVIVREYTGETPDIIRFPGGTGNLRMDWIGMRRMVSGLDDLGYRAFDWTASAGDAEKEPITYYKAAANVLRDCRKDVNIVLMHDKETTANAIGVIVPTLRERDYTFDTLDHYAEHSYRSNSVYERYRGDAVIPCTEIILDSNEISLMPQKSAQLTATMVPDNTTDYLRFLSDDPSVASVTLEGMITGIRPGTTHIRAIASSGAEAVCTVKVAQE